MNPLLWEYINFALPYDFTPKVKETKPDSYYEDRETVKVGTGTFRNGKEIMKTVPKGEK